ncbi:MAG TPA: HmuY family protein [Flavobacterium sp.]|uniref:HmuY family protein n=1 Tax=unclassified Flavobacterium TaxID=196869 RepID=UPI0025BC9DBA|nr:MULTISPECIES: HmuY family protein [unclassified Flavobacterium]HRE78359.1 HmuY family protein [Flavobacterium sp.]
MKKGFFILSLSVLSLASCSSDDEGTPYVPPISEAVIEASTGGPNQQNQLYVDLSTSTKTSVARESWDLGFSSGSAFRVAINGSLKMAVKQLNTTNIDEVQTEDASVSVGFSTLASLGYVDNPTGILEGAGAGVGTAIAEISANDADNKVYLVNLGFKAGTTTPNLGAVATDGDPRGWKKIRITRSGDNYVLQYADLGATTHSTVTISKNTAFHFSFFSLVSGQEVAAQPEKNKWDLNFTTFTNYFPYMGADVTYGYADFITTNVKGGTTVYELLTADVAYDTFGLADVIESSFTVSATDQRVIGANWRLGGGPGALPSIRDDRFYIVKDVEGNIYKLRFLSLTNDAGERGFPVFEYEILN